MKVELTVPVAAEFDAEIARLRSAALPSLLSAKDGSAWDFEVEDRLGWVDLAQRAGPILERIDAVRSELAAEGLRSVSLTGMGGSSMAPEVMARTAGVRLQIVDSTDPNQVAEAIGSDLHRTVLVVASKSGTTIETNAIRRAYAAAFRAEGIDPGSRMIAITDQGTELDELAAAEGFRAVFYGDANVGGRFSALSSFGLVPAGLAGADVRSIVADAVAAADLLGRDVEDNPALRMGTWLGIGHARSTEKLVLAETDPALRSLSNWIEQLVAESTGKNSSGFLPVVVDGIGDTGFADARADALLCTLGPSSDIGSPSGFNASVEGSLGAQFLFWEFATTIAAFSIGVNPFDQTDVESSKEHARDLLADGIRTEPAPAFTDGRIEVFGDVGEARTLTEALAELFSHVDEYGYIGIQAYLDRIGDAAALDLRPLVSLHSGVQATFGFGPRYLHSTGQYHKGGHPNGVFLQVTAEARTELLLPGLPYTFGQLQRAQALGDATALADRGRRVLRLHLLDRAAGLEQLRRSIAGVVPSHHYGLD